VRHSISLIHNELKTLGPAVKGFEKWMDEVAGPDWRNAY
jgi:hypothetical protein